MKRALISSIVSLASAGALIGLASHDAANPFPRTFFSDRPSSAYAPAATESGSLALRENFHRIVIDDPNFDREIAKLPKESKTFAALKMPDGKHDYLISTGDETRQETHRSFVTSSRGTISLALDQSQAAELSASVSRLGTSKASVRAASCGRETNLELTKPWAWEVLNQKRACISTSLPIVFEARGDEGLIAWGDPRIRVNERPRAPYNIVWIVIDSLRADAIASLHTDAQDARNRDAPFPALDAALAKMPGLLPNIEALASKSLRFTHAYSAGTWTKPGTLAMLSGTRSSLLGVDPVSWSVDSRESSFLYADPSRLLPALLGHHLFDTRAIVANPYIVGTSKMGLDVGFARVIDFKEKATGGASITREAESFLASHREERFFAFINFNDPHEPWQPEKEAVDRIPVPPDGPSDPGARAYLAEVIRDDVYVGSIVRALESNGLRENTIVVLTSDHGETLSSEHDGISAFDPISMRYHHQTGAFEETTHAPLLVSLPRVLPSVAVSEPVSTVDIVPTLLELEGIPVPPHVTGTSLIAYASGHYPLAPRPIVSEGRAMSALLLGKMRLIVREGGAREVTLAGRQRVHLEHQLFDLESDPGERHDLAKERPEEVKKMLEILESERQGVKPVIPDHDASIGDPEMVKMLRKWGYVR